MWFYWLAAIAVLPALAHPTERADIPTVLHYKNTTPGEQVAGGTELRILPVGDSITVGYNSDRNGGDGDGYRRQLRYDLSSDNVVFAGTVTSGTMEGGYYAAWNGKTIKYMSDHVEPSLDQRPNVILLFGGTNDMNPNDSISTEGHDPVQASERLGKLIDQMLEKCPDATILVAMIIDTCAPNQEPQTQKFQSLVPGVVQSRKNAGHHVLAVDFTTFGTQNLGDCIHPTNDGYKLMGHYWYDFITQIPRDWIKAPVGDDPVRPDRHDPSLNGGIDNNIPAPNYGKSPLEWKPDGPYKQLRDWAVGAGPAKCLSGPSWTATGEITGGIGKNGDWKYHKDWAHAGQVFDGKGLSKENVRLHDMDGDGKADYVWVDSNTGELRCWLNKLPGGWTAAGSNNSIISSGAGKGDTVFLADLNGDGLDDYLVFSPFTGSVHAYFNFGPDANSANGWKFVDGGEVATGVPHANLATIRFPDINGDGRADYVYVGKGGSLNHWLNTGSVGGTDILYHPQGGITTGAVDDFSKLVFGDINGDGRDDYLIFDDNGGLGGFLNQRNNLEGVPLFIDQGGERSIFGGSGKPRSSVKLADMDGDGKDDYVYIGDNGSLEVWYNRGRTDDSMAIDGLRFADIAGSVGGDDYVYLNPKTGAPTVYANLGGTFRGLNNGQPIASGTAPASHVQFGDIDGDGYDDYLTLDPKTGELKAYLYVPSGRGKCKYGGCLFNPVGTIASGLGPGKNVRIADIDGDGRDDYIYLSKIGKATIYRNLYDPDTNSSNHFSPLPEADAPGIHQRPEEISFHDVDGDGKADYVWTRPLDGQMEVWLNMYPAQPAWKHVGVLAPGVGTSGANVRYASFTGTEQHPGSGRTDYVAVDPGTGALAVWLSGCDHRA